MRAIFELFLSLGSIQALKIELDRRVWLTPIRSTGSNREMGGRQFSTGHLRNILQNRVYRGRIVHKGVEHEGLHPAIIDEALWNAVQEKLQGLLTDHHTRKGALYPSLLSGLLYDADGRRLNRAQTFNHSRSYRYYVFPTSDENATGLARQMHVPSEVLESEVMAALLQWLEALPGQTGLGDASHVANDPAIQAQARELARRLRDGGDSERIAVFKTVLVRVNVLPDHLELMIRDIRRFIQAPWDTGSEEDQTTPLHVPFDLQRFRKAMRLVVPKGGNVKSAKVEPVIGSLLVKAQDWSARLRSGRYDGVQAIASEEGVSSSYVTRVIYLSFLAPDLALRIFLGDHPQGLTTRKLLSMLPLPERWSDQRSLLGMEP